MKQVKIVIKLIFLPFRNLLFNLRRVKRPFIVPKKYKYL